MATSLVVMAAGRGSRFGGMKQIAPLGPSGESLFDYAVYDALRAGFERVVFVVSADSRDAVKTHVDGGVARAVEPIYVEQQVPSQRSKPWGTGHAVLTACAAVDGAFGVVNADDFYGRRSFDILGGELSQPTDDHLLAGYTLRDTLSRHGGVSRGVCRADGDRLIAIDELHDVAAVDGRVQCREGVALTGDELVSVNLWGFRPSFATILDKEFARFMEERGNDDAAEFLIGDAVGRVEAYGDPPVRVVPTPERFLGVTFREDVDGVRQTLAGFVAAGDYASPLWQ